MFRRRTHSIQEFDANIVKELRNRARDVLLTQAIAARRLWINAMRRMICCCSKA